MKKITLTFFIAVLACFAMNAQVEVYFEGFETEDLSEWTLHDVDGDGFNWGDMFQVTDGSGNAVSPVSLISRSWQGGPLTPDNWAITPAIDLTGASGSAELTWKVMAAAADWDNENYSVYVATSNEIADLLVSDVTFTETYDDPTNQGTQYERTLDLSSLMGEVVYVAFRHHDVTDMDWISIDDVKVTAEEILSVDDNEFLGFNYFVNNNTLNLSSNDAMQNISIYNIIGKEVVMKMLNNNQETIDISALQPGIYITKVSIDGVSKTFKIHKN
ncbi:MAG TPA: choice-of-anchor J domain-containing protein [Flavobacteriaceae bacterium]|nr:choice-of-anchor J domain-containing protein [Flavobacteriaceae bacterium]